MSLRWVVGLDYSMTCPAITIAELGTEFSFSNCRLYYLSDKLPKTAFPNITGTRLDSFFTNEQRFDAISDWAVRSIQEVIGGDPMVVFIEDYSYGSKGQVFHIAENSGLVKHKLWKLGYPITPVPPTVIKKFATTKGTATKDKMYEAFVQDTQVNLMQAFQPKAKSVGSPVGDLVDSFYICKYGFHFTD